MAARIVACIAVLALASYVTHATDPNQLQDFCVGTNDRNNALFVDGKFCKNPADAVTEDFFFSGLHVAGSTNNRVGSNVTLVSAAKLPGLNTLGISLARVDFAPRGLNPTHTHPRASEVLTVLEGSLYVGFITSNIEKVGNRLFAKVLHRGDAFVFPQGLIHFQYNFDAKKPAVAIVALSSQNPGTVTIANAVFGSDPPVSVDVLSKAFQLSKGAVANLQAVF